MSTTEADVLVHHGRQAIVELPSGEHLACLIKGRNLKPVCGDKVQLMQTPQQEWVVESLLPRKNHFVRIDKKGRSHIIAANLDQAIIVIAPKPEPSRDLMTSYLAACHSLNIKAVVLFNKIDLQEELASTLLVQQEDLATKLGYDVLHSNAKEPSTLDELKQTLTGKRSILVGQSGVGKSSLAKALIPDREIQTAELAKSTGKGAHTTTHTSSYHLPFGGSLVDSPGVWEFGLWSMGAQELAEGFRDFQPYIGHCKFSNCSHLHEPGCAIMHAVKDGNIEEERWLSYQRILNTMAKRSASK